MLFKNILFFFLSILFCFCACRPKHNEVTADNTPKENNEKPIRIAQQAQAETDTLDHFLADEYEDYFVIVADTGVAYYKLHPKMFALKNTLKLPIDTMGRFYNKAKNLIALKDNDEDQMYAGAYFPRRELAENLSLEYLNTYKTAAKIETIALVTGIYEHEKAADSALKILKNIEPGAFKVKAHIYMGCMH